MKPSFLRRTPFVVLLVAVVLAACSSDGSKPTAEQRKKKQVTTTTTLPPPVAPLTGLPDPTLVAQLRPVVSIKIDNNEYARPQTGLEFADIVWDEVVEGEATRFLAMFQSQSTDVVGPVRSVRLTDALIVWPVGGVFAYSGGAKYAIDGIAQAPVKLVDESAAGDAMFRDSSRRAPHNLYSRPELLFALGGAPIPPPPLFEYLGVKDAPVGIPVISVRIGFSGEFAPTYTWDAASGSWLRSTQDGPFMSKSGVQIAPRNVVVLPAVYAGGLGEIGAEAQLVGSGPIQVFTGGVQINGTWARADKAARLTLTDTNGAAIRLSPGSTWVELPDVSYAVDVAFVPVPAAPAS